MYTIIENIANKIKSVNWLELAFIITFIGALAFLYVALLASV